MNKFATYRSASGKTLDEVSKEFRVSTRTILRWEQGKTDIPIKRLSEVARITGLSKQDLRPDLAAAFGGEAA